MVQVPPNTTNDLLILLLLIALVMLSILIVDWIAKGGPPTGRYLLLDLLVSALIIVVPPLLVGALDAVTHLISDSLSFGDLAPYVAFIVAIYSIKKLLGFPRYKSTTGDRTWENAIWTAFFAFLIYVVIASLIDALAAAT